MKVELCGQCGGVWIEWFDGPVQQVSRKLGAIAFPLAAQRGRAEDDFSCPECRSPLVRESRSEASWLYRCGVCAGAFVPREALDGVAWDWTEELDEDEHEGAWVARLLGRLKEYLGIGE